MTKIEYVRLEDIKKWDRNPRIHDIPALTKSLKRFGFINPIVLDERSQCLVAGHGRAETLEQLKASGALPPKHIVIDKDGGWRVPVLRGVEFKNDDEFEAFGLADNRMGEVGSYDPALLAQILDDLNKAHATDGIGWSEAEIEGIIAANQKIVREVEERDEDEGSTDLLEDLRGGSEIREIVLHLSADEYDLFVGRLQRVMAIRRLPGYVEAVSALLDHWEAEAD